MSETIESGTSVKGIFDAATGNQTHDPALARLGLRPLGYTVLWQSVPTLTYVLEVTITIAMMSAMVIVPCSITT